MTIKNLYKKFSNFYNVFQILIVLIRKIKLQELPVLKHILMFECNI
ncbi:hypothetical protein LMANV2_470074 [Leptospira interrogans serovar Manilae]|uniref:Uncharacterized protein n=2 Tax=Leptospira interrogans TaxID=173 RepID=A0AAQ1SPM5_LEPIR|nr:hypothetical protein G436_4403 [Leptospira interrogans serovar Hardjo str. Norma]SOR62466.1 hypothetical protein LMANV2_470074 [Leptospira interrogans serovar Manilae]